MGDEVELDVQFDVTSLIQNRVAGHYAVNYGAAHHNFGTLKQRLKAKFQLHDMLTMALRRITLCEVRNKNFSFAIPHLCTFNTRVFMISPQICIAQRRFFLKI